MRYYCIEITDSTGQPIKDATGRQIGPWDSSTNPAGALNVMLDLPVMAMDVNMGGGMVIVGGLPLSMLSQSVNLWMANITIYAGFQPGLPLASAQPNPGIIMQGQIWNPYGNWEGTLQTLNLVVNPAQSFDAQGKPISIPFDGKRGEKLSDVLKRCLTIAYPKTKLNINIHQDLVLVEDLPSTPYSKLSELALMIKNITPGLLNVQGYTGVQIVVQRGQINIFDSSYTQEPISIALPDLIGQPTWMGYNQISFKTPMRADLQVGDIISLIPKVMSSPAAILAMSSPQAYTQQRQDSNFHGEFSITSMRHIGEYRNASGTAWVTAFEAQGV